VVTLIGFGDVIVVVNKERHEQIKEKLENIEKKQDVIKNKK
jgi:nitrate reductase NapAB chaperone NapD